MPSTDEVLSKQFLKTQNIHFVHPLWYDRRVALDKLSPAVTLTATFVRVPKCFVVFERVQRPQSSISQLF